MLLAAFAEAEAAPSVGGGGGDNHAATVMAAATMVVTTARGGSDGCGSGRDVCWRVRRAAGAKRTKKWQCVSSRVTEQRGTAAGADG